MHRGFGRQCLQIESSREESFDIAWDSTVGHSGNECRPERTCITSGWIAVQVHGEMRNTAMLIASINEISLVSATVPFDDVVVYESYSSSLLEKAKKVWRRAPVHLVLQEDGRT